MIRVDKLSKKYSGKAALDEISFHVAPGEVVGFLGPNGAGKTTAMRILTGYLAPTAGEVEVDGISVLRDPIEVRRRIGYLPENSPLYNDMRVDEYLRYRGALKGCRGRHLRQRLGEVKDVCGLEDCGRRIIRHLSKGYRQRVGLAEALIHDPKLIVLDEPTVGLDPNQIREVRRLVKSLADEHTLLISTHILSEAEMVCSRVLIIDQGRIIAQDTPSELRGLIYGGVVFTAEVAAPEAALGEALRGMEGVRSFVIEGSGDWLRVTVNCAPDLDLRSDFAKLAARHCWGLRELHIASKSLEEIFVSLTRRGGAQ
jgi:ABC-2 type transport system ATP-binding protein